MDLDTEITLKADGSGTMSQKADLPPSVATMAKELSRGPEGTRFVVTEQANEQWKAAADQTGIRVLSYKATPGDDGSLKLAYELEFARLQDLASSVWAWPLQLRVSKEADGTSLEFTDPLRFAISNARGETRVLFNPPERGGPGWDRYVAFLDVVHRASPGMRIRTVVHFPAPVRAVEGAPLSDDKLTCVYETTIGEKGKGLEEWLAGKSVKVALAPDTLAVEPFSPPTTAAVSPKAPEPAPEENKALEFRVSNISVSTSRSLDYRDPNAQPQRNESLQINLELFGPPDVTFARSSQQEVELFQAIDAAGNDLRQQDARLYVSLGARPPRGREQQQASIGQLTVRLKIPPEGVDRLARLDGQAILPQVAKLGESTVKPIRDNLNTAIPFAGGKITFTKIEERKVSYTIEFIDETADRQLREQIDVSIMTGEGQRIQTGGRSTSGRENSIDVSLNFDKPLPEDCYAVITWPEEIRKVVIPFLFENLPIP